MPEYCAYTIGDDGHFIEPTSAMGGFPMVRNNMPLTRFGIDDGPHSMDGLRLLARDGTERVEAFIGRKVMDVWVESIEHRGGRQSLFRDQYNALGKRNLAAIERIVNAKYQRGAALNRQHPYVEVLFSDITESGEALDLGGLVRLPLPPAFLRLG
jgi:hypothetical protein